MKAPKKVARAMSKLYQPKGVGKVSKTVLVKHTKTRKKP